MNYVEPSSIEEACALLRASADPDGARLIAGGTAVVLMMRQGLIAPATLVSLRGVDSLDGITVADGRLSIGATVTLAEVARSYTVRRHLPSLARACGVVGNVRIRNAATLGGNLAEADYASDPPTLLCCLGAICVVQGPGGRREVAVRDLITGYYETSLASDEIIVRIDIDVPARHEQSLYLKYVSRSSEDRPCVGVAARARLEGRVVGSLEIVVGAVASTPRAVPEALERARGERLDEPLVSEIADAYAEAIEPLDDVRGSAWYRTEMIRLLVQRALEALRAEDFGAA